jgi:hypothetical protein
MKTGAAVDRASNDSQGLIPWRWTTSGRKHRRRCIRLLTGRCGVRVPGDPPNLGVTCGNTTQRLRKVDNGAKCSNVSPGGVVYTPPMKKKCSTCGKAKSLEKYFSNGYTQNGTKKYKPNCSECEYKIQRARYDRILTEHFGVARCQQCGYDKCFQALECHHTNSDGKDFRVSQMVTFSKKRIIKELKKCILVCANCHREIHHLE